MRCFVGVLTVTCVITVLAAGPDARWIPKLSKPEAEKAFAEGRELFDQRDWRTAEKRFKECKRVMESRASEEVVDAWIAAAQGGRQLAKVEKLEAKKKWLSAWKKLTKTQKKYEDTPLRASILEVFDRIEPKLFMRLATFEEKPPAPEANVFVEFLDKGYPEGISYNTDRKFVKSGDRSLKWSPEFDPERMSLLPLGRFKSDSVASHPYLYLSIYSPDATLARYALVLDVGSVDVVRSDGTVAKDCFFKKLSLNTPGWTHLRINARKEFARFGEADFAKIEGLSLVLLYSSPPGQAESRPRAKRPTPAKTIYADDVKLGRG